MPRDLARKAEYARQRRLANPEALRAKQAEWRDANREHLRARSAARRRGKRAMCLVASARIRAKRKGLPFSLEAADVDRLQRVIDAGLCELTGAPFALDDPRGAASPSLDRIVPARGYVPGNVRVVCHAVNAAMGAWGEAELRRVLRFWKNL